MHHISVSAAGVTTFLMDLHLISIAPLWLYCLLSGGLRAFGNTKKAASEATLSFICDA